MHRGPTCESPVNGALLLCLRCIGRAPAAAAGPANHVVVAALHKNHNLSLALDTGWCARAASTLAQVMTS